jgi:hypothetical protein
MNIPGFIARQFYVAGSLRNTDTGWELQAHNPMGDGVLVGVGTIKVDGTAIPAETVAARRTGEAEPIRAADVSRERPVSVFRGDRVTLEIAGTEHRLDVELYELTLGRLSFAIKDTVR